MERYAVIMAGGAGERFWPLSRIKKPKHLWNVAGSGGCLLEQAYARAESVAGAGRVIVITNAEQVDNMKTACPNIPHERIISEPAARDTTAAVALGALLVNRLARGAEASFAVFPSDHVVNDTQGFAKTLNSAFDIAESGDKLVTIGIEPSFPATGYGYIKRGEKRSNSFGEYFKVSRFFEKPNLDRARAYLNSGQYYWNAGMFIWKTSSILNALKKYLPESYKEFDAIACGLSENLPIGALLARHYPKIEKISIDFSVMERADNAWVVPAGFDWDDVGSWPAIARHHSGNSNGNVACGRLFERDSKDCIVFDAAGRATAIVGVKDLIIVHSEDSTLVCSKSSAEDLKGLVRTLPEEFR